VLDDKIISEHIDMVYSAYHDLDYWINSMTSGKPVRIPDDILKMDMKHLRNDMNCVHKLLCEIKERGYIAESE